VTQPEYPPAAGYWQAKGFRKLPGRTVRRIVLHVTSGGPSAEHTASYFASGAEGRNVSAHFVVGHDGEVWQCVALDDVANHAHAASLDSIGIEHCAREPHELSPTDAGLPMSDAQYQASARLVGWLCDRYDLPRDRRHVLGHSEVDTATTHTGCPQSVLDWARYMTELSAVPSLLVCE
jgi:N-acetyl-anhydromuramyl-L-alanine amidase AmpD